MELLKGLNVVVTGAASGIGAETAVVAAEAGARVALLDLKPEAAEEIAAGLPGGPVVRGCDIADIAGTRTVFDDLQQALGCIDAVVHAAGIWFPR